MVAAAWGAAAVAAGAAGNGSSDDRAIIQACIDAAESGQAILEGGFDFAVGGPVLMKQRTNLMGWGAQLRPTGGFSPTSGFGSFLLGINSGGDRNWSIEGLELFAKDSGGTVRARNGIHLADGPPNHRIEFVELNDFPDAGIQIANEAWRTYLSQVQCNNCGIGINQNDQGSSSFGGTTTQSWNNIACVDCPIGLHLQDYTGFSLASFSIENATTAIRFGRFGEGGVVFRGGYVKNCQFWIGHNGATTGHSRPSFYGVKFEGSASSGTLIDVPVHPAISFFNCQFSPTGSPTVINIASGGTAFFFEPDLDLRTVTTACGNGSTIAMVLNGNFYRRVNNGSWSGNLW